MSKPMDQDWRYEITTNTIRTTPGNHWVCTMDSWDGALDHQENARRIVRDHNKRSGIIRTIVRKLKKIGV